MKLSTITTVLFFSLFVGLLLHLDCDLLLYIMPDARDQFVNKIVWIVGASSGIGSQLAIDLCQKGAKVILSGRRQNRLQEVVDEHEHDVA